MWLNQLGSRQEFAKSVVVKNKLIKIIRNKIYLIIYKKGLIFDSEALKL